MNRDFFYVSQNHRLVRGFLIKQIQNKLTKLNFFNEKIDGVFGFYSKRAISSFQEKNNLEINGNVDFNTWNLLFGKKDIKIFDRCLQISSDFEGHGFEKIAGNFDNAGLTWGVIGFNLKCGTLQKVLHDVNKLYPNIINSSFDSLAPTLFSILKKEKSEQIKWANSISIGKYKYLVDEEWSNAFFKLGTYPEVQMIQLKYVQTYWDRALSDLKKFNLKNELSASLCFDIAVQNGGIDKKESAIIQSKISAYKLSSEKDIRTLIANTVAENSNPRWIEDVRARKLTLATGEGLVHKTPYLLSSWGLEDLPIKK